MKLKKVILIVICISLLLSLSYYSGITVSATEMIIGVDFEQSGDCNFYSTDYSTFSTTYMDTGRSAGLQAKNGSQLYSYFDTSLGSQYADSQAIVFWIKTPEYDNPTGDLPNINIGLICGDTRWKLNQNPTADMKITCIWASNNYMQEIPLTSQGGGVFLDTPSNFEGYIVIPVSFLVKDWGPANTINLSGATVLDILWEWLPTNDINKMFYIDNAGFTNDIDKYLYSLGVPLKAYKPMVTGIDFEQDSECAFYNVSSYSYVTSYKDMGRSISFTASNGSQITSSFDSNVTAQFKDSETLAFWLKTPQYDNPSGDLPNINIGLITGNTRWKLNQNPTTGMSVDFIWTATNQIQTVSLTSQGGGVYLDAPSNFEGWVIIPLNVLVKDWGPATELDPCASTEFNTIFDWLPLNDIGKTYFTDSVGFINNIEQFYIGLGINNNTEIPRVIGNDLEGDSDCAFYTTDYSTFSDIYKDNGRSAGLQTKNGTQITTYFDTTLSSKFSNAQAISFWIKTPSYDNPSGDLPNLNIGLICGDTRWKLNQSPSTGMYITYTSSNSDLVQIISLASQGGGVFLDAPSNFEGWVTIPFNVLVKDWGSASSIIVTDSTTFNIVWEWLPTADINKMYYIDNVGFTKFVTGVDYEQSGDCSFTDADVSLFSSTYKNSGTSAGFAAKNGTQFVSYFDTNIGSQYSNGQAIVFWLKTPEYYNPTDDLPNINFGLICGDTRWWLDQSPSSGQTFTCVWSKNKLVQKIELKSEGGGVYLDAPSNFEGWVIIPLSSLEKHWGSATSINLAATSSSNILWDWVPTNDSNKMYYFDNFGFTNNINGFIKSSGAIDNNYVLNEKAWRTPYIDRNGFVFEVQALDYSPYIQSIVKNSIYKLSLGESKAIPCNAVADEWENTYIFYDNGLTNPVPTTRQQAVQMLQNYFHSNYIQNKSHLWKAFDGNFLNQHYTAEFGADIIGAEIGCDIKGYQMSIAYTRGAAKQYGKPWFIDYSPWYNSVSILDYSDAEIWGDSSGDEKGHSLSQFERSYYMSYMSGANWLVAEAGGINYFYPETDSNGLYKLSPLGKIGQKFNAFVKKNSDIGIPYTPFGLVIDYYHGTSFGSDYPKKAFETFSYNSGDELTWSLIQKFFPDSWTAWNRQELGQLVKSPYGDTCDVLLQNASQEVLNSYPVIVLAGDITLSSAEIARIKNYVYQGGRLVLNTAYLTYFPEFVVQGGGNRYDTTYGSGNVMVYGPNYDPTYLDSILSSLKTQYLPFSVSGNVQYIINIKKNSMIITVINNEGITKPSDGQPVIDSTKTQTISINYTGTGTVRWVKDLRTDNMRTTSSSQSVTLTPGELAIFEFGI